MSCCNSKAVMASIDTGGPQKQHVSPPSPTKTDMTMEDDTTPTPSKTESIPEQLTVFSPCEGLVPGELDLENVVLSTKHPLGGVSQYYRTHSDLVLQVDDYGMNREQNQLQTLFHSLDSSLRGLHHAGDVAQVEFDPEGCLWKMEFHGKTTNGANATYRLQVRLLSATKAGMTHFVASTILQPKVAIDPSPLAPPLKGYKEAKAIFEKTQLTVRKSVVRHEFPEFPEGCKGRPFKEVYQLNLKLKSGSFATVYRGTHRSTNRKVAIKCVLRRELNPSDDAAIFDEVAIMASLNHPQIVPLLDFFDEDDCYYIVMELMSGGDLFDRIGQKKTYSEADARDLIVKMLKGVNYFHQRKIAHCDMKPKNLLLKSDDNDSQIKLADFGFASRAHEPKSLTRQCGTPFFVAPEILLRKPYDQQADMWSVGCIVFLLLSGNLPFMGRSQKELFKKIVSGSYEFDETEWEGVSEEARDLVRKMLVINPDERMTAAESLDHKWLKIQNRRLSMVVLQGTSQRLKTFNARMKLRSTMIAVDWISSLKRMSWTSSRSMGSDSGGSSEGPSSSSNPLLAAAKLMKVQEEDEVSDSASSSPDARSTSESTTTTKSTLTAFTTALKSPSRPATTSKPSTPSNPLLAAAQKMKVDAAARQENEQSLSPEAGQTLMSVAQNKAAKEMARAIQDISSSHGDDSVSERIEV